MVQMTKGKMRMKLDKVTIEDRGEKGMLLREYTDVMKYGYCNIQSTK